MVARRRGRLALALALTAALALDLGTLGPARAAGSRARPSRRVARAPTREPAAAVRRSPPSEERGRVQFVTDKRVYLDRGAADGLAVGQALQLIRNGRPSRFCTIEIVGDHAAVGHAPGAHPGDQFRIARRRPPPDAQVVALAPLVADAELQARAEALAAAPHEKVDFAGQGSTSLPPSVTIAAGVTVWSTPAGSAGPNASEELDVQLRRIRLGQTDLRFDAAFSVVRWQRRAAELRFRPDSPTQLYLWEAEVSRRELDDRTVFAFGRVWPWHIPGVAVLDGVQLGRRNQDGTAEGGAYAGTLPTALAISPATDTWMGGLYGSLTEAGSKGDLFRFARQEARVGMRHSPTIGTVSEGEVLADVARGAWAADGSARVRYAPAVERRPALEQAYLALRLGAPSAATGGWLQLRYLGVTPEQQPLLVSEQPALRGAYHAALNLYGGPAPWLQLAVSGSVHTDRDSGFRETEANLELRLPRLFGAAGGLWLGAAAAEGWLRLRSTYLQLVGHAEPRVQVLARLIASANQFTVTATTSDLAEVGGYLQIDVVLSARLRMRARGLLRVPVLMQGQGVTGDGVAMVSGIDAILAL